MSLLTTSIKRKINSIIRRLNYDTLHIITDPQFIKQLHLLFSEDELTNIRLLSINEHINATNNTLYLIPPTDQIIDQIISATNQTIHISHIYFQTNPQKHLLDKIYSIKTKNKIKSIHILNLPITLINDTSFYFTNPTNPTNLFYHLYSPFTEEHTYTTTLYSISSSINSFLNTLKIYPIIRSSKTDIAIHTALNITNNLALPFSPTHTLLILDRTYDHITPLIPISNYKTIVKQTIGSIHQPTISTSSPHLSTKIWNNIKFLPISEAHNKLLRNIHSTIDTHKQHITGTTNLRLTLNSISASNKLTQALNIHINTLTTVHDIAIKLNLFQQINLEKFITY